ncbi:MAG: 2OG-Fe(II) oxygenase, partial [Sulfurimonas sp.]|nr:2OG-Fe(II) oxygenase [Sulfurimonas sp.]
MVEDGYAIIPNALNPQLTKDLLKFAQKQTNFKKAGISSAQHLDTTKRSDKTLWLDEDADAQSSYLASMQELQNHLNKEL